MYVVYNYSTCPVSGASPWDWLNLYPFEKSRSRMCIPSVPSNLKNVVHVTRHYPVWALWLNFVQLVSSKIMTQKIFLFVKSYGSQKLRRLSHTTSEFMQIIKSTTARTNTAPLLYFISPVYLIELPEDCLFSQTLTPFPHPALLQQPNKLFPQK